MTSPSPMRPPISLPGGPLGVLTPESNIPTGLLIPRIEMHVRAPDLTLVGEITAWARNGGTIRYNNVGDWALEIDLDDPMAAFLQTPKYGLFVVRWLETEQGVILPGTTRTLFSGDVSLINPSKQNNTLAVSFKSDLRRLRNRPAFPVTVYPYNTLIEAYGSSLKRFYRLNESAGTNATDSSTSAQTGTYTNGPTLGQPSILGDDGDTCVSLDGVNDYVSAPTTGLATGSAPFSIGVWTSPHALAAGDQALLWCGTGTGTQLIAVFLNNAGLLYASNGVVNTAGLGPVTLDETVYVVVMWDGVNMTLSLNGGALTASHAASMNTTFGVLRLGASNTPAAFYNGKVSKWEYYNRALTADEIARNYAVGNSRFAYADQDARSGVAETVIKGYVDASIGPDALPLPVLDITMADSALTIATDIGRGDTVNESARFDMLVSDDGSGLLQRLGQNGGVGFDITQFGTELTFDCYVPADKTSDAVFSDDLGNLADYQYKDQTPDSSQGGNVVIVMGGGAGTNRIFRFAADTASIARWGVIMGQPVDARDTTDASVLDQRGADAISKSAEVISFSATLDQQRGLLFGRDFWLGDTVTVYLNDGSTITDLVREVSIDYSPDQGEKVTPAIGTPNARVVTGALDALGAFLRTELQRTRARVARLEQAF